MRRMMSETHERGIEGVVELRRNLCRASMNGSQEQRLRGPWKEEHCRSQDDRHEARAYPACDGQPVEQIHASSVRLGAAGRTVILIRGRPNCQVCQRDECVGLAH
jgi:hypothetical protein